MNESIHPSIKPSTIWYGDITYIATYYYMSCKNLQQLNKQWLVIYVIQSVSFYLAEQNKLQSGSVFMLTEMLALWD